MERAENKESVGFKDRIRILVIVFSVVALHLTIFVFLSQVPDQEITEPPDPKEEAVQDELTPPAINVEPSEPSHVFEPLSDTTADPSSTQPVARSDIDERWRLPDGANIQIGRTQQPSGLSDSSLYGLSEAQIRERLGIPTAGRNGFLIIPGIGIDGPWWDKLHGVNKACSYSVGIGVEGQRELKKSCPSLKPSSKDKIGFKPKSLD